MGVRLRKASRHTFHNSLWPREARFKSRRKSFISTSEVESDLRNLRGSFFRMPFSEKNFLEPLLLAIEGSITDMM